MQRKSMNILKKMIPDRLREKILEFNWNMSVKRRLTKLYFRLMFSSMRGNLKDYKKEIHYIAKHGISMFPYSFSRKYADFESEVTFDHKEEKYYALHRGKKLYFPKGMSEEEVKGAYKQLVMEQEAASPHRYWSDLNRPEKGDTFIDVGAAEGIIALELIDIVDRVILVECEDAWKSALEATFALYRDKVEIVSAYCCEKVEGESKTTIDHIAGSITNPVIKMDIEGAEIDALKGAKQTLLRKDAKWAICTYHTKTDAENIESILKQMHMKYEYSDGYLLLPYDLKYSPPYFRRGVLRAKRQ